MDTVAQLRNSTVPRRAEQMRLRTPFHPSLGPLSGPSSGPLPWPHLVLAYPIPLSLSARPWPWDANPLSRVHNPLPVPLLAWPGLCRVFSFFSSFSYLFLVNSFSSSFPPLIPLPPPVNALRSPACPSPSSTPWFFSSQSRIQRQPRCSSSSALLFICFCVASRDNRVQSLLSTCLRLMTR